MTSVLGWKVVSEMTARRFCWGAGVLLASACTALVLAMLLEFGMWARIGLMASVVLSWMVLGGQFARMVWSSRNRTSPSVS
jgi:hypothetical protein